MSDTRLESAVREGEALRYQTLTRGGRRVGLTDTRLLLVGEDAVSVPLDNVESVDFRAFDWFLAVLSVFLVAVGGLTARNHPLVGAGFVLAGLASLVVTYRKRGLVTVHTHAQAKPVQFHLEDTDEFRGRLEGILAEYEAQIADADDGSRPAG